MHTVFSQELCASAESLSFAHCVVVEKPAAVHGRSFARKTKLARQLPVYPEKIDCEQGNQDKVIQCITAAKLLLLSVQ